MSGLSLATDLRIGNIQQKTVPYTTIHILMEKGEPISSTETHNWTVCREGEILKQS